MRNALSMVLAFSLLLVNCKDKSSDPVKNPSDNSGPPSLESSFADDAFMPFESGKDNGNVSPPLTIKNVPAGTVEMALTMRDIDHGNSWHWAIWNIPKTKTSIAKSETWSGDNVTIGSNDYGSGYVGPFPPSEHRYKITVYFLSEKISLLSSQYNTLPSKMSGLIIDQVSLTGHYD